jgi:hypothetical protein
VNSETPKNRRTEEPRGANAVFGSLVLWFFGPYGLTATITVGVILAAWLGWRWYSRFPRRPSNSPRRLFKDLCNAHGLSFRERSLMTHLAGQLRLAQPAILFVEPGLWDERRLGPTLSKRAAELATLRERLFAKS